MKPAGPAAALDDRLASHLSASGLLAGAHKVIVALSGGGDSTALLLLLVAWARRSGATVVPCHVAHGLRGEAGLADARFCADLARDLSLPFRLRSVEARALRRSGESLEAAGRRLRYEVLLGLSADLGEGTPVATGHTLDDQAETVLLNLARKTGRDRGGIRVRRSDGVVRPLLPFLRAELRTFLEAQGASWREDETNRDERIPRNRIRLSTLPALEERWPGTARRLARAAQEWTRRLDALDATIDRGLAGAEAPERGPWPRALFASLGPEAAGRLLVRAAGAREKVPGREQVRKVLSRLSGLEESFAEGFASLVLAADARSVRLAPPARLKR